MDTIFALATARGRAGVAIVRISGSGAFEAAERLCGTLPEPRRAGLRDLRAISGELIDKALVLRFARGASFTGEDVAEFHLHGSAAVVGRVLSELSAMPGCRLAEAGEFTRRALENDVLDLAEVEGLGDLIDAETEAQRRQAMRVFDGDLSRTVERWRRDLLRAVALLEATIDFADEEVPVDVTPEMTALLSAVRETLATQMRGYAAAERVREGFEVALVGEANVGKSTLLNRLAGREAAITSEIAGTTRDVIEVRMDIGGLAVTVLDTAGVRSSEDKVERIGIGRTLERARAADLRVFLLERRGETPVMAPLAEDIVLVGKSDLVQDGDISGKTGAGVAELLSKIGAILEKRAGGAGLAIKLRHKVAMEEADLSLRAAAEGLRKGLAVELVAEDIRRAVRALDSLVGRIDVEHILGEIFARFCVGK